MKKSIAIIAVCVVLGGGVSAGVALVDRGPDVPITASVEEINKTIQYHPHDKWGGAVDVRWGPALFEQSSDVFNYDLALVAGALSAAAWDGDKDAGVYIIDAYKELDFAESNITLYSYPKSSLNVTRIKDGKYYDGGKMQGDTPFGDDNLAFSIASRSMKGGWSLLAITLRSTVTDGDKVTDADYFGSRDFLGADTHNGFHAFFDDAKIGLEEYLGRHPEIQKNPLKVLVTGYSLGGAGANLLAAWLNSDECGFISEENVYAYTMAAPFNYNGNHPNTTACKNIFNVVNKKDPVAALKSPKQLAKYTTGNPVFEFLGAMSGNGFAKRFGIDLKFSEGDTLDMETHAIQLYIAMLKRQREISPDVAALEAAYAESIRAEAEARSAAEAESLRQVEEEAKRKQREAEEAAAQRADDEIKAKLTKLAEEANAGAAFGSLFSFGAMETQVCAFGESRQKYGLIYKNQYTYNVVDVESERRNLQSTVNFQSAMFQGTLNTLQREGIPNAVVIVQYLNRDGSVIYEQEFN